MTIIEICSHMNFNFFESKQLYIHDYSVKHNNINIFSMTSIKQHLYKNLSPNFKLNRFLYRGGLNCKFYPDRLLNLRFLLMGFYCIV